MGPGACMLTFLLAAQEQELELQQCAGSRSA